MGYRAFLKEEKACFMEQDPSLTSSLEIFMMPGYKAIKTWYWAHKLYQKKHFVLARWMSLRAQRKTGIDIHPGATIGKRFFIDHGSGVVIGETCIIGNDVKVYQGVTLGGTGKDHGKRHPTVEDNVLIGCGAKIIGNIVLGKDSKVGAGAIVIRDVAPGATVVCPPAYPVRDKAGKMSNLCIQGKERWTRDDVRCLQSGRIKVNCSEAEKKNHEC
ncbi:serine acetyltransferase [Erysipelotrichaceae bacterium RD49]|nr:serine acetyltransferase [Erysipelotrichaceae bacterium RD49]